MPQVGKRVLKALMKRQTTRPQPKKKQQRPTKTTRPRARKTRAGKMSLMRMPTTPYFGREARTVCMYQSIGFDIVSSTLPTILVLGPGNDICGFYGWAESASNLAQNLVPAIPAYTNLDNNVVAFRWGGLRITLTNTTQMYNVQGTVQYVPAPAIPPETFQTSGSATWPPTRANLSYLWANALGDNKRRAVSMEQQLEGYTVASVPLDERAALFTTCNRPDYTLGANNYAGSANLQAFWTGAANGDIASPIDACDPAWVFHVFYLPAFTSNQQTYHVEIEACCEFKVRPGSSLSALASTSAPKAPNPRTIVSAFNAVPDAVYKAARVFEGMAAPSLLSRTSLAASTGLGYRDELRLRL